MDNHFDGWLKIRKSIVETFQLSPEEFARLLIDYIDEIKPYCTHDVTRLACDTFERRVRMCQNNPDEFISQMRQEDIDETGAYSMAVRWNCGFSGAPIFLLFLLYWIESDFCFSVYKIGSRENEPWRLDVSSEKYSRCTYYSALLSGSPEKVTDPSSRPWLISAK